MPWLILPSGEFVQSYWAWILEKTSWHYWVCVLEQACHNYSACTMEQVSCLQCASVLEHMYCNYWLCIFGIYVLPLLDPCSREVMPQLLSLHYRIHILPVHNPCSIQSVSQIQNTSSITELSPLLSLYSEVSASSLMSHPFKSIHHITPVFKPWNVHHTITELILYFSQASTTESTHVFLQLYPCIVLILKLLNLHYKEWILTYWAAVLENMLKGYWNCVLELTCFN